MTLQPKLHYLVFIIELHQLSEIPAFRGLLTIASLRDWLPMLMNVQVRVADVEEKLRMVADGREEYK